MINKIKRSEEDVQELDKLRVIPEDIKNDNSDYSKVVVEKPWGYEYLIFSNQTLAIWILYLKAGAQTSMHCHPNKKTSLVVLEGEVRCSMLAGTHDRSAGEGLLIEKGVFHQTMALSESGAFIMEIETPVNKRDLVRLRDKYGREGKGYETEEQYSFDTQNYNYVSLRHRKLKNDFKKRFYNCSVTFRNIFEKKYLNELSDLEDDDIICILDGKLLDLNGGSVLCVGDTTAVRVLRKSGSFMFDVSSEILVIKKMDRVSKVSDILASYLNKKDVKPVFIVPGESNVHLLDSIGRCDGLSYVRAQNEKSASFAVEGFCKLRLDVGVLVVSSGASVANTIPGIANAWVDSAPMLIISGQARTDQNSDGRVRQLGNKSLNIVDLAKPITKYSVKVDDPKTILYHLEKAIYLGTHGRPGPVLLDIPIDVQGMTVNEEDLLRFSPTEVAIETHNLRSDFRKKEEIQQVLRLLKGARRPVILAGNGIRHAKAVADFLKLIDLLRVPVLCSRRGADIVPDDHQYFLGRPGTYGQRSANFIIQNCDLLISIGSRLSIPLIGCNTEAFTRAAQKVVVDIDVQELQKRTLKLDLAIESDAGEFIRGLLEHLPISLPDCVGWIDRCREWEAKFLPDFCSDRNEKGDFCPLYLMRMLSNRMSDNDVVVVDGGGSLLYTLLAFQFKLGQRLISSTGLELPGFALAGAIGACVARDKKPVICLCEDRGFQNSISDLQTIMNYRLPIKILLMKSNGPSIIRNIQRDYFEGRFVGTDHEIRFKSPSLIEVARVYGFPIAATLLDWFEMKGPVICEIPVENDQDQISRPGFTVRDNERWIARPLEDMVPFLDRDIFQENMIIDLIQDDLQGANLMRLADYVIEFFENQGVEHIFTVVGGGSIFLCDALTTAKKMKYVACHHEQAASMAAEAYARARNGIGVNLVTVGPGATNTVTGVAGAWLDHVPHVTISGQAFLGQTVTNHPGLRTLGVQEISIVEIIRSITKYAVMIEQPQEIRYHLERAVYLATHGRPGPVWIDIPSDIQNAQIDQKSLRGFSPEEYMVPVEPELVEKVRYLVKLLKSARRPLIHVGQGVRISGAEKEFFDLIEKYRIPFVTARNANDIVDAENELCVGRPGTFAQRGANFAVQTSDLYLAIGTRLSLSQTGFNSRDYARNAKIAMVDIDQAELDKGTLNLDLKIQADAKLFLEEFERQLSSEGLENQQWSSWILQCQRWKLKYPAVLPEYREQIGSVNSYHLIDLLSDVLTPEDTIVTDMGFAFQNTHQAFRIKKGQRMFTNCGLASMGWGLPAAVGACFATGRKRTICLAGEGGLSMNIQEMATVMHHRLPIKLFVFNNGGYLTIKQTQELGFDGRLMGINQESGLSFPNLIKIAEAYEFKAIRLDSHQDLKKRLEEVVNFEGPVFCEVMMDHNQLQAPRAVNRKNSDGTMKQTPLEDSYPFLDPREIQENLNIVC